MSLQTATAARRISMRILLVAVAFGVALVAAWGLPQLDHALNPGSTTPGLISFLGVGLAVLAITTLLLFIGLRGILPKTGVFLAAALGYNALLISVKFSLAPLNVYVESERSGFIFLNTPLAFPGLTAITAILYGLAFFVLYAIYRARLQRRLGVTVAVERRFLQLILVMFVLAVVGGVTVLGLVGFLEYALSVFLTSVLGVLIAFALVGAVVLCSVAFGEATSQAAMLRNVSLLSTFAWIGLAFIAAYHILLACLSLDGDLVVAPEGLFSQMKQARVVVVMLRYRVASLLLPFLLLAPAFHSQLRQFSWRYIAAVVALFASYIVATCLNDVFDLDVDRINHPGARDRPLVTGEARPRQLVVVALAAAALALFAGAAVGVGAVTLVALSLLLNVAYSVPPVRLCSRPLAAPMVLAFAYVVRRTELAWPRPVCVPTCWTLG